MVFDNQELMVRNNGNAANLILQNNSGNVGIGAVGIPNEKLDVDGSLKLTGGSRLIKFETNQVQGGDPSIRPWYQFYQTR
ncbi:MAG: hypothetical protein IPK57_17590 [Chitinophagaceae bacterium]|nr:hypothetical protein [Chitinophagaceae bacterium]